MPRHLPTDAIDPNAIESNGFEPNGFEPSATNTDALDPDVLVQLVLAVDERRDRVRSTATPARPVELHTRTWRRWLTEGGRPGTSSYVGPLDPARVTSARTALGVLSPRDPLRRGADAEIDRTALAAFADAAARSNERRCVTLWVAVMMWGGGTVDTRAPWRTAQGLANSDLGSTLVDSHRALRAGDLAEAYRVASSLHGVGEPNVTRWLWACSLGLSELEPTPVILDRQVRGCLDLAGLRPGHTAKGYVAYVEAVHLAAATLRREHRLRGARPETLEMALADGA